jgi:hypothetical protein
MAHTEKHSDSDDSAFDCGAKQSLTSSIIGRMIRRMRREVLATLLVLGWISLSGFDLVEDLDEIPGQVAVSSASPKESPTFKVNGQAPLANNIIESANRIQDTAVSLTSFMPANFHFVTVLDFRRHSQLHKLYRVFLI